MSWNINAIGKPAAVAAAVELQFAQSKCAEPEETVRQSARVAIAAALAAQRPDSVVKVTAFGSQSGTYTDGNWGAPYTNQLRMDIEPILGFVE